MADSAELTPSGLHSMGTSSRQARITTGVLINAKSDGLMDRHQDQLQRTR